jgi:hypothetical protein
MQVKKRGLYTHSYIVHRCAKHQPGRVVQHVSGQGAYGEVGLLETVQLFLLVRSGKSSFGPHSPRSGQKSNRCVLENHDGQIKIGDRIFSKMGETSACQH